MYILTEKLLFSLGTVSIQRSLYANYCGDGVLTDYPVTITGLYWTLTFPQASSPHINLWDRRRTAGARHPGSAALSFAQLSTHTRTCLRTNNFIPLRVSRLCADCPNIVYKKNPVTTPSHVLISYALAEGPYINKKESARCTVSYGSTVKDRITALLF